MDDPGYLMKSKSKFLLSTLTCAALLAPVVTNAVEWQLADEKQQELKRMQSEYDYPAIVNCPFDVMVALSSLILGAIFSLFKPVVFDPTP